MPLVVMFLLLFIYLFYQKEFVVKWNEMIMKLSLSHTEVGQREQSITKTRNKWKNETFETIFLFENYKNKFQCFADSERV